MGIVLCTLNARAIHASLGLRYLLANMAELRPVTTLIERTIDDRPADVVEALLATDPKVVGLGVYIWNASVMLEVVQLLKRLAPDVTVVVGGPEVSYELDEQPWVHAADVVITGEGETAWLELCRNVMSGATRPNGIRPGGLPDLTALTLPYHELSDDDLRWRFVYVEASRGCPYRCSFCLSSLDKQVREFPEADLLAALDRLYQRGARHFRFVDRTFNLKPASAIRLLEFWLERMEPGLFVHFEMVPDRFPEELRDVVRKFPDGTLQFEVGIQTFDAETSRTIQRPLRIDKVEENLRWLASHTGVHLHTDLIVGLPGEDLATFGSGFTRLAALKPHEIQVGILKRLRGTPITALTDDFAMLYSPVPPYEVVQTAALPFGEVQRLKRFARVWELYGNRGDFKRSLVLLLESRDTPFHALLDLSDWLAGVEGRVHSLSLLRLAERLLEWLLPTHGDQARDAVVTDYTQGGRRKPSHKLLGTTGPTRQKVTVRHARQLKHASDASLKG